MAVSDTISRQPTKLDLSSPTQFKFGIHQLPKVEFFVTSVNLPSITLGNTEMNTPFKDIPIPGEKLTYGNLDVSFLLDEYLENYITIHNWITGLGFPRSRLEFTTHRDVTSNTTPIPAPSPPVDKVGNAIPDRNMYSDAYLMILSNKNNPIVRIDFQDLFPKSLGEISYTQGATDVEYISVNTSFEYKIFTITSL